MDALPTKEDFLLADSAETQQALCVKLQNMAVKKNNKHLQGLRPVYLGTMSLANARRPVSTLQARYWVLKNKWQARLAPYFMPGAPKWHIDHIVPKRWGGVDHPYNYVIMPGSANLCFKEFLTSEKLAYIGSVAARGAARLCNFLRPYMLEGLAELPWQMPIAGSLDSSIFSRWDAESCIPRPERTRSTPAKKRKHKVQEEEDKKAQDGETESLPAKTPKKGRRRKLAQAVSVSADIVPAKRARPASRKAPRDKHAITEEPPDEHALLLFSNTFPNLQADPGIVNECQRTNFVKRCQLLKLFRESTFQEIWQKEAKSSAGLCLASNLGFLLVFLQLNLNKHASQLQLTTLKLDLPRITQALRQIFLLFPHILWSPSAYVTTMLKADPPETLPTQPALAASARLLQTLLPCKLLRIVNRERSDGRFKASGVTFSRYELVPDTLQGKSTFEIAETCTLEYWGQGVVIASE